jgi:hypothetical protein
VQHSPAYVLYGQASEALTMDSPAGHAAGHGHVGQYSLIACHDAQEFAWSEADLPAKREERRSGVCDDKGDSPMDTQPM